MNQTKISVIFSCQKDRGNSQSGIGKCTWLKGPATLPIVISFLIFLQTTSLCSDTLFDFFVKTGNRVPVYFNLNPNLRPSINYFATSCSGYNKSDFSTSFTQIGDDPNECNWKCLPAVTVCKGVVSKTHGTFVCELLSNWHLPLLKPQQARVWNPFWKLTPFPFWKFGANLWSLPWILLLGDGWLATGYIPLCGVETYKSHSSISTSPQKECGKRALRRRFCSSYTDHPETGQLVPYQLVLHFSNSYPIFTNSYFCTISTRSLCIMTNSYLFQLVPYQLVPHFSNSYPIFTNSYFCTISTRSLCIMTYSYLSYVLRPTRTLFIPHVNVSYLFYIVWPTRTLLCVLQPAHTFLFQKNHTYIL
jgi:hypothetical protein